MAKKIIPYNRQSINKNDINEVNKVLKSSFLTQGPKNKIFCKKISNYTNSKYSLVLNSASSALQIACLAMNLNRNDILWTSANTFVSSATAGVHCGAKIDFVDIDLETGNLSIIDLERKLKSAKKKKSLPKILIVVHFAGISCDMKKIKNLSKKYKFKIIEDASHALGSKYYGNKIGSCKYSDACIFSFHPIKSITTFEGGAITTNSKKIYELSKLLSDHGIVRNISKKRKWLYDQKFLGFNFRLNDVSCAIGISQLLRLEKFVKIRNNIANFYFKNLRDLPINLPIIPSNILSSFHLFVISIKNLKRDDFYNFMLKRGIKLQYHYIPVYKQTFFKKKYKFNERNFLNMEEYFNNSISLPIYVDLKKNDLIRIVNEIKNFFKK
tara:strand:+ start:7785 stop:8933 length:1149 start_codon:yes stop_codon:yes gene_type:complete